MQYVKVSGTCVGGTLQGIMGQYRNYWEENNLLKRKMLKLSFVLVENNFISQASKDTSTIWSKNI